MSVAVNPGTAPLVRGRGASEGHCSTTGKGRRSVAYLHMQKMNGLPYAAGIVLFPTLR